MRKLLASLLITGSLLISVFAAQAVSLTPVGYWDQYDDKGQLQSLVKIWQDKDELKGQVIKGFPVNGKAPNHYCTKCSGDFKDKRITDLTFIWGARYNSETGKWEGGHILDPNGGSVYKLIMSLTDNGQQLLVRGYLGISLFGRTQTWTRITEKQMKEQLAQIKKEIGDQ